MRLLASTLVLVAGLASLASLASGQDDPLARLIAMVEAEVEVAALELRYGERHVLLIDARSRAREARAIAPHERTEAMCAALAARAAEAEAALVAIAVDYGPRHLVYRTAVRRRDVTRAHLRVCRDQL